MMRLSGLRPKLKRSAMCWSRYPTLLKNACGLARRLRPTFFASGVDGADMERPFVSTEAEPPSRYQHKARQGFDHGLPKRHDILKATVLLPNGGNSR
jgi:hypothetical protein